MKLDKFRNLPVYKKAEEIFELARAIADALKEGDQREFLASEILLHASIMQVKSQAPRAVDYIASVCKMPY